MAKTTKGDGMERRAERWCNQFVSDGLLPISKPSLTRLLRKVAIESAKAQKRRDIAIIKRVGNMDCLSVEAEFEIITAISKDKARWSA